MKTKEVIILKWIEEDWVSFEKKKKQIKKDKTKTKTKTNTKESRIDFHYHTGIWIQRIECI